MPLIAQLQDQLKWKTRALEVVLEIDRLRDSISDERRLIAELMNRLTEAAEAELGLLFLRDDEALSGANDLQLRHVVDRARLYSPAAAAPLRQLAERATTLAAAETLASDVRLHADRATYCLAASLHVNGQMLGALLLINEHRPFNGGEAELINAAISQIDSALHTARILRDLTRKKRELETIYRIDLVRDRYQDIDSLLNAALPEICAAVEAETGFVMLYDHDGTQLELRAATDHDLHQLNDPASPIHAATQAAIAQAGTVHHTWAKGPWRALVCQPLILHGRMIGVLGMVNRKGRADFTRHDLNLLGAIVSQVDTAIFEGLQTQRLRNAFGQCVGPQVMDRLLRSGADEVLTGDRLPLTTLFSDIRGFTDMSERLDPNDLQAVLNDHLSTMTEHVLAYEGTLDKYIGDCVMCFFNAPERQPDHALRAVRLALDMQAAHHQVMARWHGRVPLPPIGIGISTGETMVGNFGSVKRLEYTTIGHDVNLAARLCGVAEADEVLISHSTYELVQDYIEVEAKPVMQLKGIHGEVTSYRVLGLK